MLQKVADRNVNNRLPVLPSCLPQVCALMRDCFNDDAESRSTFEYVDVQMKRLDEDSVESRLTFE